jgi:hypothetical protein
MIAYLEGRIERSSARANEQRSVTLLRDNLDEQSQTTNFVHLAAKQ